MDRDLVEQAQRGDREAFAVLARAYGDRLFAIAQRILRDIDLAEDALQQTLVIAWRELPRLRDPDRFEAWLQRTLVNACYVEARRARLERQHPRAADRWTGRTGRDALGRRSGPARPRVPPPAARPAGDPRLHYYLGLEPAEIAETLGIPAGTARSRLHYAHRAMRAALEADARSVAVAGGRPS